MTIGELVELNEKFQKSAVQVSELIPASSLTEATSLIMRNCRGMHASLENMLEATTEMKLGKAIEKVDEQLDEIVFILDQIEIANRKQQISLIADFLKEGYDLLALYSMCVDQIIKEKVPSDD